MINQDEQNPTMRASEVRKMLGNIGRNTLYDWCREGLIPHKRVGRIILFSRRRLEEWLENEYQGGKPCGDI